MYGLEDNAPSPSVPKWFEDKLIELGGRHINGTPNLRVVWGQSERHFACGGLRIKYPTRMTKESEEILIGLKDIDNGIITVATLDEVKANTDPKKIGIKRVLSRKVDWIGIPNFVIEEYIPPERIRDTPLSWYLNQHGYWYNPETKRQEWTKILKDFPHEGDWQHFMTVKENDGTYYGKYRPLGEDVLEDIRKALRARDRKKPVSVEQAVRNAKSAQTRKYNQSEAAMSDAITQELKPFEHYLTGSPRIAMRQGDPVKQNKQTKFGRAKETV